MFCDPLTTVDHPDSALVRLRDEVALGNCNSCALTLAAHPRAAALCDVLLTHTHVLLEANDLGHHYSATGMEIQRNDELVILLWLQLSLVPFSGLIGHLQPAEGARRQA